MADMETAGLKPVGELVISDLEAREDVSAVVNSVIHAVEQRAAAKDADARKDAASLLDDMVGSVSRMVDEGHDAAARSVAIAGAPDMTISVVGEAGLSAAMGSGMEERDLGAGLDEDVPRAGVDVGVGGAVVGAELGDEDGEGTAAVGGSANEGVDVGGGGWWRWLFSMGVWMAIVMVSVAAVVWLDSYMSLPPCSGNSIGPGTVPLAPGDCIEWDGGSRGLLRLLPGVKAKSRLTVTHGGGVYRGTSGVEIPIGDVMIENQSGAGLLCGVEQFTRKAAGVSDSYTAWTSRSRLVFGAGTFCTSHYTPAPPSLFDKLRRGEASFSDAGDLQVVGRRGKVVWSAADSVGVAGGRGVKNPRGKGRSPPAAAEEERREFFAGD